MGLLPEMGNNSNRRKSGIGGAPLWGLPGAWWMIIVGVVVELLVIRPIEWILPRLGVTGTLLKFISAAGDSSEMRTTSVGIKDSGGIFFNTAVMARRILCPMLRLIWSLKYNRVLRRTVAEPSSSCCGHPCPTWFTFRGRGWPKKCDTAVSVRPKVVIAYIHGGGFHTRMATEYAFAGEMIPRLQRRAYECEVVALYYPLSDVAGRSEQVDALHEGWLWLSSELFRRGDEWDKATLVVAGDSAGGHLATALTKRLVEAARHRRACEAPVVVGRSGASGPAYTNYGVREYFPDALLVVSPWLDVDPILPRRAGAAVDYLTCKMLSDFSSSAIHGWSDAKDYDDSIWPPDKCLGDKLLHEGRNERDGPERYPPLAMPEAWPSTAVVAGGAELLAGDGFAMARSLSDVTVIEGKRGVHDYVYLPALDSSPGIADAGLDEMANFIIRVANMQTARHDKSI